MPPNQFTPPNMAPNIPPTIPPKKSHTIVTVVVGVLVLGLLAWAVFYFHQKYQAPTAGGYQAFNKNVRIRTVPNVAETAPKGSLVKGFPKDLIVEKDAVVTESQFLTAPTFTSTSTAFSAKYTTGVKLESVVTDYLNYLRIGNYTLVKNFTNDGKTFIIAITDEYFLSLAMGALPDKQSEVRIFLGMNKPQ